jgi:hypothetical protein
MGIEKVLAKVSPEMLKKYLSMTTKSIGSGAKSAGTFLKNEAGQMKFEGKNIADGFRGSKFPNVKDMYKTKSGLSSSGTMTDSPASQTGSEIMRLLKLLKNNPRPVVAGAAGAAGLGAAGYGAKRAMSDDD